MGSRAKKYTKEFKSEAVRLLKTSGKSVRQIAQEIGVTDKSLYAWRRQDELFQGKGPRSSLTSSEREALQRLREENRVLRLERDLLKKSVAFFATETRRFSR